MSIEREQPSTGFRSMPAYGMDTSSFKAQPIEDVDGFKKLGDIKDEFQADELTGTFDALNETTNFDDMGGVRGDLAPSVAMVSSSLKISIPKAV